MTTDRLYDTVSQFAALLHNRPDGDLDLPWAWQSYDFEGVRFAFFRTYEELNDLAFTLSSLRTEAGQPLTPTQRILSLYHAAFRDLEVILLGLSNADANLAPAKDEWSVRDALAHIVQAEVGFYVVCRHALEQFRLYGVAPNAASMEEREKLLGVNEAEYERLLASPLTELRAYHAKHHERVLSAFDGMTQAELVIPAIFWEEEAYPLQFRLFRFDSHLRQHTVQVAKALIALGRRPTEAQSLLHLVYAALAEVEALASNFDDAAQPMIMEAATVISGRTAEIRSILEG